jgi:hypothetical protein
MSDHPSRVTSLPIPVKKTSFVVKTGAMTFLEAALEILRREGRPLHYKELTERAMGKKLLTFVGRTPEVTMQTQLTAAVKKAPGNPFVRVKPGVFGLLRYPELSAQDRQEEDEEEAEKAAPAGAAARGEGGRRRRRRRGGRGRTRTDEANGSAEGRAGDGDDEGGGAEEPAVGRMSAEARAAALAETGVLEADEDEGAEGTLDAEDEISMNHDEDLTDEGARPSERLAAGSGSAGLGADVHEGELGEGQLPPPRGRAAAGEALEEVEGMGLAHAEDEEERGEEGDEELEEQPLGQAGLGAGEAGAGEMGPGGDELAGGRRRRRRRRRRRGEGEGISEGAPRYPGSPSGEAPLGAGEGLGAGGGPGEAPAPGADEPRMGGEAALESGEGQAPRRIMTPVDAALEILRGQAPGRGVHVRQIADAAARRRLIHGEPNEAWRVMRAALAAEPRERLRAGLRPRVRAAGTGLFALARRPPDAELERAEQVFGEARRALRERTVAALERRIADLPPAAFEAIARVLLQREGFGPATFVKRVEGTIYVEALRGRGSRPSKCLIALRPGGTSAGRRAIGELRAGMEPRARNQDEGLLMLAGRLGEDAIREWRQPGQPIEIADGQAMAETCLRHGIGVINAALSVDFVDADFFAELAEG